jgi:serine protease SohB
VENLRQEISAVLTIATPDDEVLVRLESGGGTVHGYGLGASQLQRIRDKDIPLTVSVDKVAASGGYMMACVANHIISAPFAILGSIGVLAQIPNLHRLLKKNKIDFEQLYAGEYKRTLTLFGENTEKGRAKMQEDLEDTHRLFKEFVKSQRPGLDIEKVATGEHWLGTRALELGLVDELKTSDDYLMSLRHEADLVRIEYTEKKKLLDKLSGLMTLGFRHKQKELQDISKPMFM